MRTDRREAALENGVPELLLGATMYGPAIDMWSAGCIFYELIGARKKGPRPPYDPLFRIGKTNASDDKLGNTYERKAIETWFATKGISPMTNMPVGKKVVPVRSLRKLIEDWSG